ncbi:MAG: 16S rRNA (adenine(1518)-N(6)/adenine(1519)-N(6))-dimethyltransferase RsmA [Cytophagaceae bacterium]|nr:16S rRNA (adenine(1518)-N(6)/adenine(1519)-N(6))-dimethyltransferase RsmA [Cytophagaceae bacterium]MDW8456392.1 16S rRNA (adenine(1518)-N(6)/adenine(1519)-N(6))-dimethyltransferase RsmA [Cytophagaceae bacterium]
MKKVTAKKSLGQHFLTDKNIAEKIVNSLSDVSPSCSILEIGPGMGILTGILIEKYGNSLYVVEIDAESVRYLSELYPSLSIIHGDFLKMDITKHFSQPLAVIGNFPYNISSQIFFKLLNHREQVREIVCMLQKEVAERIASVHNCKSYGILSVLLQAFYKVEYLFTVHEHVFSPAPKVKSGVIRLTRNPNGNLGCNEKLFFTVVKTAFNQRRKTLRNALKNLSLPARIANETILNKRAEQLSVSDFIYLTHTIENLTQQQSY